jgi:hypothetical protein
MRGKIQDSKEGKGIVLIVLIQKDRKAKG